MVCDRARAEMLLRRGAGAVFSGEVAGARVVLLGDGAEEPSLMLVASRGASPSFSIGADEGADC
jgi:hypothetical protein